MWSLVITLFALIDPVAEYRCMTQGGRTECGYRCQAANGELACARTPQGVCATGSGRVVCWDPPEWVRAHYRERLPLPGCLTRLGETACGYHCWSHDGEVRCAASPDGVCLHGPEGVTCWDPAPSTYCLEPGRPLPRPRCVLYQGQVACGYNCEARSGQVRCATTPAGRCIAEQGRVMCFDPPVPEFCEDGRPCPPGHDPRPWCRRA